VIHAAAYDTCPPNTGQLTDVLPSRRRARWL